jgi:hypothetical protein
VRNQERNRRLERLGRRWVKTIEMELGETDEGIDWNDLAQDRYKWRALLRTAMKFRVS